ncbi:MAG: Gfo/Idh/MocA family oxidoreductase [Clostridia bacterium]|nr:Gfo/Idh/MocA family oxidoreductase [Clostridia bacterium]
MKTIGIGVIGWGFMGKTHTQALRSLPLYYQDADFRVALKCVCARHIENARAAARDAGFERYTDDYRELLAMPDIDVVSVCTPNERHEEMVIAAIRAGKHVYVDKPLAVTGESADRIARAAAESDVFTQMVFNIRYFPATMRTRQLVEEGRIGEVLSFNARYLHSGSIDPNKPIGWKLQAQGGVLLDMGSHALDLVTWLAGWPKRVFCKLRTLYPERPDGKGGVERALGDDQIQAFLELENGAVGCVEASKIATGTNDEMTLEIRGTKGALIWRSMDPSYLYFYDNTLPEAPLGGMRGFTQIESVQRYPAPGGKFLPVKNAVGWDRGHLHCYFSFLDDVAHGRRPENGVAEGARLQRLMDALKRSDAVGAWVDFEG